jgi:APA family basic amino acid/polyamine antiporter
VHKLKREVGLFGATMCILGIIVGAGIYVIIGEAAGIAGNALWLSFLLGAVIAACTGLSYAELASSFPCDSAEYHYTKFAFNDKRLSFGIAWLKITGFIVAMSAVALGFGGYLSRLTGINFILCALLLVVVLTIFNLLGLKQALWLDILMVFVAISGLVLVITFGIPYVKSFDFYLETASGIGGIFTSAALIFFAFLGFENIGNMSEEVRNPKKTLPLALLFSVVISVVLYMLVAIIAVSVVPWSELAHSTAPLSDVMTALLGSKAGLLLAIMALAATGSTVLGLMIAGSRMLYGIAEEGAMPSIFLKLSRKRNVPYVALVIVSAVCTALVLTGDIKSIAFLTDFSAIFIFIVINLCVITLRFSHHHIPRGFRMPVNIGKFPVFPAVGLISCIALLFGFTKKFFLFGILLFLSGLVLYGFFGRQKKNHNQHHPKPKH